MKKNKPFRGLFYRSLKKTLKIMRNALILLTPIRRIRSFPSIFQIPNLSVYLIKLKTKANFSSCTMKNFSTSPAKLASPQKIN